MSGNSARQGGHHDPQNISQTGLAAELGEPDRIAEHVLGLEIGRDLADFRQQSSG